MTASEHKSKFLTGAYWSRTLVATVAMVILGFGSAMCQKSNLGMDPFSALNMGIADKIGIPMGPTQLTTNIILFVIFMISNKIGRSKIGAGSVINMVMVGFFIQWFSPLFETPKTMPGQLFMAVIGLLIFTCGAGMYQAQNVGLSPYDAVAPVISEATGWQYKTIRVIQDSGVILVAWLLGGPVGVASIIMAFFTGPLISFWVDHFGTPLANWINKAWGESWEDQDASSSSSSQKSVSNSSTSSSVANSSGSSQNSKNS